MNAQQASTTAAKMHPAWIPMDPLIAPVSRGSPVTDAHVQVKRCCLIYFGSLFLVFVFPWSNCKMQQFLAEFNDRVKEESRIT